MRVIPRASKAGIAGVRGDALLVRLHAPPVDGAANAELIAVIATTLGIPRRRVTIRAGERSKLKRVSIAGISIQQATEALQAAAAGPKRAS